MPSPKSATIQIILWSLLLQTGVLAQRGHDLGIPGSMYPDPVTGRHIRELTSGTNAADNLYFHFSNFIADNSRVLFVWQLHGSTQLCEADPETGRVTQLTDSPGLNARSACPDRTDPCRIYLLRGAEVLVLDRTDHSEKRLGEIPPPRLGGFSQPTLSGDGRWLALSKQRDASNWEIGRMNTETGEYQTVLTQGFQIGHVQHSPIDPVIFYVWETGGFAPQRTWLVNADGSGNRPFYYRVAQTNWLTPLKEWVTHEAWIGGTGDMTMVNDKVGVMVVKPDGTARVVRDGNYWHAAARPDGKYIVADDMKGGLWLIETATGSTRLLATGLRDTVKVHAHASFDRLGHFVEFHTGRTRETVAVMDVRDLMP